MGEGHAYNVPLCFLYETVVFNFQHKVLSHFGTTCKVQSLLDFLEEKSRENSLLSTWVSVSLAHKLLAPESCEEHSGLGLASSSISVPSSQAPLRPAKAARQHLVLEAKSSWEGTILCAKTQKLNSLAIRLTTSSRILNKS